MLENECLYHVYNQGNNKEEIFQTRKDYLHFLHKVRNYISPCSEIFAYCLMPNHFHFLIYTTQQSIETVKIGPLTSQNLKNEFRKLLSFYSQVFNKQANRSGSLFRQKTKFKEIPYEDRYYPFTCFNYIHQNPLRAGLAEKMEDWGYSSFQDYIGIRNGTLCNKDLAKVILDLDFENLYGESYGAIDPQVVETFF